MNDNELQKLLNDTADNLGVAGAQLAIYDGNKFREFVTGYRNLEMDLPVTPETLFQIGSTTKIFNAALLMTLVDSGKLELDVPVSNYIAKFRLASTDAEQKITLRQLLSMSAGLDNGTYYDYGRGDDALGLYVETLACLPQIFEPGTAFGYSNASTTIAGHAAACVTGQVWEDLLKERIWDPLALKHCAIFAEDLLRHPVALGYQKLVAGTPAKRVPVWSLPVRSLGPAGAVCSNARDLVSLARLFLDHGQSTAGVQILSEAAVETMQRPQVSLPTRLLAEDWCVGPFCKRWGGCTLYGHSGTNLSGSSMLLWCPERNVAIATVVNVADQGYPLADAIFEVVFPEVFGIDKPASPTPENIVAVAEDLSPYVGRFEAFDMKLELSIEAGKLMLNSNMWSKWAKVASRCELIPLGDRRFLPSDSRVSGNRNWDIAFWGSDDAGRATHVLQGVFALRRTS